MSKLGEKLIQALSQLRDDLKSGKPMKTATYVNGIIRVIQSESSHRVALGPVKPGIPRYTIQEIKEWQNYNMDEIVRLSEEMGLYEDK